jgi:hypothetical protein
MIIEMQGRPETAPAIGRQFVVGTAHPPVDPRPFGGPSRAYGYEPHRRRGIVFRKKATPSTECLNALESQK